MAININWNSLKKFGENLKDVRERRKFTQEDVAKGAGISTSYYARVERGEENPTYTVIQNICKSLKVKSSEVLSF